MPTICPSTPSTTRSTSCRPPWVRMWYTRASATCAATRTVSVASDSNSGPIMCAPDALSREDDDRPSSRAARAGSVSWCLGACWSRRIGLFAGSQPGTGSSIHRRVRRSRYTMVVVWAGCAPSPPVVASSIRE